MAKRIQELAPKRRAGRYPWKDWSDGSAWRLTRGDDFDVSSHSMGATIRSHAWRRNLPVRVHIPDDNTVEFQFLTNGDVAA